MQITCIIWEIMKKTTRSIQGATKKVILCRVLQNFKQRLKIFGWILDFSLSEKSERDLPTSERENGW